MDYRTIAVLGPFLVPLGAFAVAIAAIVSGAWSKAQTQRIRAEQRMTMLGRGVPLAEIEQLLGAKQGEDLRPPKDPLRSLGNARRTGIVLVSSGLGVITFGVLLTLILRERDVLVVAAAGLIPFAIGIGFFIDYNLQKREMSRFGLEVGAELPTIDHTR